MAVVSGSNETLQSGQSSTTPFAATGTAMAIDCDTVNAKIYVETTRGSGDPTWKSCTFGRAGEAAKVMVGPCHHVLQTIPGRKYRIVCQTGPADVAADQ